MFGQPKPKTPTTVALHSSAAVLYFLQAQQQTIRITNTLKATVEGDVRPGSSDRYSVTPSSFRLKPGDALELTVTLKLGSNFAQRQRAVETGQRDPFYIKVGGHLLLCGGCADSNSQCCLNLV